METLLRSPSMSGTCGISRFSSSTASRRSTSGRTVRFSTASCMASLLARRMLIRSIMPGSTTPTATARARSRTWRQTARRWSKSMRSLESLTRRRVGSASRITHAATTGPARQPRPTSSVPAMARKPKSRSRRSTADISATRASSANTCPRRSSFRAAFLAVALALALLFDARGFAAEIPEVVELRAADPTMAFDLDLIDRWRVEREHAFDADAAGDLAHGEHLARAASPAGDDDALEDLDALFIAFLDLHVHLDGVARGEVRDVGARFARLDQFHDVLSHCFTSRVRYDGAA